MWALIIIVALGIVLFALSRLFNKIGDYLIRLSRQMADSMTRVEIARKRETNEWKKDLKEIKDKIHTIRGEDTDDEFNQRVQQEIDELLR